MNSDQPDPKSGSAHDSREKWITIDRLCDAYEASLQEGRVERAPFLAGVPRQWREQLTQELDAIDAAYRDAEETREQTLKVPPDEAESRRLPTKGRLAELASLDRDKIWLGRFEIRKRLGTGATGSVWCARDARLARWVALKVPHASRVMSETSAARFQTEARAAAAISHPNVVQVHEVLIEDGLPILIQQWIDGPSLAKFLKDKGPMEFDQAADWMAQIADAVACAHDKGIVHRDLKPANVMLNKNRPMVLDFGLASYPQFSSGLTTEGAVLGTPAYMSPEQAEGAENANQPATDIYALGTILYEMLVGTPPFVGKAREVLQANKTAIPTPPRNRRAAIPRDLETIVLRCLSKSPGARYRSAGELRDDLQRFRRREPIHARKVSLAENAWAWCRFHPAYGLLALGIPLVTLLMLGILVSQLRQVQLTTRANQLVRENLAGESELKKLLLQRQIVELSRASHELSEGDRTRGLELLRNIPEPMRKWEWRLLDLISHSRADDWSIESSAEEARPAVTSLVVAKTQHKMFAACGDGTILFWQLPADRDFFNKDAAEEIMTPTPKPLYRSPAPVEEMAVSPNDKWLSWVDRSGNVVIWDIGENEMAQRIPLEGLRRGQAIAFSLDSKQLVVGGGSPPNQDRPNEATAWVCAFHADESGEFFESFIRTWKNRAAITSVCFFDQEHFALTRGQFNRSIGSSGMVETWKCTHEAMSGGSLIWRGLGMRGLDFEPVSNRIAWCDDVGIAYIKELNDSVAAPPQQFQASQQSATQVRFSPDGQEIVVTGADGGVSRWSVPPRPAADESANDESANDESANDEPANDKPTTDESATDEPAAATSIPASAVQGNETQPNSSEPKSTKPKSTEQTPAKPTVTNLPPIRHIRDYRGHENLVRDVIYLAPCQTIGGKSKPRGPRPRFCKPFLVTAGEDGRVLRWSNEGHDAIKTIDADDRPLVGATWVSPRQIAVSTRGVRRQKSVHYQMHSLPEHQVTLERRRVRLGRTLTTSRLLLENRSDEPQPARYAVASNDTLVVFDTGNSAAVTSRPLGDDFRGLITSATMIDSQHVVVSLARNIRLSKEAARANPDAPRTFRQISLLLYDLGVEEPPQQLLLPKIGAVTRLRRSPHGAGVVGCTNSGKVFVATFEMVPGGRLTWSHQDAQAWTAHVGAVRDFTWIGDQGKLATVGDDGICAIWNPSEQPSTPISMVSSGDQLTAVTETPLPPRPTRSIRPLLSQRLLVSSSPVMRVTACSQGNRIATAGADRVVRIWDTESGLELISLQPKKDNVMAVEFSPDDRYLMIAEANARIEVIRLKEETEGP